MICDTRIFAVDFLKNHRSNTYRIFYIFSLLATEFQKEKQQHIIAYAYVCSYLLLSHSSFDYYYFILHIHFRAISSSYVTLNLYCYSGRIVARGVVVL